MAMAVGGGKKGPMVDMNVTPLIDVLLVLLIIFMVITPLTPKGLDTLVPQPSKEKATSEDVLNQTIVVSVDAMGRLKLNQDTTTLGELGPKLEEIFKTRNTRIIFVKGDPSTEFGDVAAVIDVAKGAAIDKIGLITKSMEEGN